MKRNIKKAISILCLSLLLMLSVVPAFASTTRGVACPFCGKNCTSRTQYGSWEPTSNRRDCIDYVNGYDLQEERDVYQVYSCGNCGANGKVLIRTETQWVCHGYR